MEGCESSKGVLQGSILGVYLILSFLSSSQGDGYTIIKVFIEFIVESFQLLIVEYNCGNYQTFVSVIFLFYSIIKIKCTDEKCCFLTDDLLPNFPILDFFHFCALDSLEIAKLNTLQVVLLSVTISKHFSSILMYFFFKCFSYYASHHQP